MRGDELLAAGDYGDAAIHYQRVVGFDDPAITAAALLGLGEARYRLDDEDGAVATWEAAIQIGETSSAYPAWRNVAAARVRSGDLRGAQRAYREADRRAPAADKAEIASRLGWLAKEAGDAGTANRYFAKARGDGPLVPVSTIVIAATAIVSLVVLFTAEGEDLLQALWLDKLAVADGEYWRLWTVTLVHADLLHLFFNMYALYLAGPIVERWYGSLWFLILYLLCAAAGSVASFVFGGDVPAVGASGAIFGLFGVLLAANRAPPSGRPGQPRAREPARVPGPAQPRVRIRLRRADRQRGASRWPVRRAVARSRDPADRRPHDVRDVATARRRDGGHRVRTRADVGARHGATAVRAGRRRRGRGRRRPGRHLRRDRCARGRLRGGDDGGRRARGDRRRRRRADAWVRDRLGPVFATLLGPLPRPPLAADATRGAILDAIVAAQVDAGLEPVTDGGWPIVPDDPVAAWRATADRTDRAAKAVVVGPYTAGVRSGGSVEGLRDVIRGLAAAGCPIVEVAEPAAVGIGPDRSEQARFRDLHDRLLDGLVGPGPEALGGTHLSLAITGGAADTAGAATILGPAYASLAVDLIAGPDNWRLVRSAPGDRGIVCGALSAAEGSDDGPETLLWAAAYAAGERRARARSRRARDGVVPRRAVVAGRRRQAGPTRGGGPTRRPAVGRAPRRYRSASHRQPQRSARPVRAGRRPPVTTPASRLTGAAALPTPSRNGLDSRPPRCHHRRTSFDLKAVGWRTRMLQVSADPIGVSAQHVPEEVEPVGEHIQLTVNGTARELDVEPRRLLVQALREDLDLTGTHVGCDTSQCGACTVHVDGHAVKSCTMLAVQADGATVTTIEGMAPEDGLHPLQNGVLGEARPAVRVLHARA